MGLRLLEAANAKTVNLPTALSRPRDVSPKCLQGSSRAQHIVPFEEAGDLSRSRRQRSKNQGSMGNGLVSGDFNPPPQGLCAGRGQRLGRGRMCQDMSPKMKAFMKR